MTARAFAIGLFAAVMICGITFFNDAVIRHARMVGSHLPLPVYGAILIFIFGMQPLLRSMHKKAPFTGREMALMLCMVLCACSIPATGFMRIWLPSMVIPHHQKYFKKHWGPSEAMAHTPKYFLVDNSDEEKTVKGFINGLGEETSIFDLPWEAWKYVIAFWFPFMVILFVSIVCLGLIVHRQWSQHEHLPYPIAEFTNAILPDENTHTAILKKRSFWVALTCVSLFHLNNYLFTWFPENLVRIPRSFDFTSIREMSTYMKMGYWSSWNLFQPGFYFMVIGFAYFLPKDVSLSVGIGPYIYCFISGLLVSYNVRVDSYLLQQRPEPFVLFGAGLGIFLMILYTGRFYYKGISRQALFVDKLNPEDQTAVHAMRVWAVANIGMIVLLAVAGLEWQLGILYVLLTNILFVVMGRIIAETGIFVIQVKWTAGIIIAGFLGYHAVGPEMLVIMMLISVVLTIDPRETLMPFLINGLKICEQKKVPVGKAASATMVALVLGLAVAIPVTMYLNYTRGANRDDAYANFNMPRIAYDRISKIKTEMKARQTLDTSLSETGFSRFTRIKPYKAGMIAFGIGLALVLIFSFARLYYAKFPFHPIMFLLFPSFALSFIAFSILTGWFIKVMVMKYGGSKLYQNLKPMMIGLIAGEMLMAAVTMIIGGIYYFVQGKVPVFYTVSPI